MTLTPSSPNPQEASAGKGDVGSSIAKKTPTWLLGLKSWAYGLDAGDSANSEYSDLRSD